MATAEIIASENVSFDYSVLPIRDLEVVTEVDKKSGKEKVKGVVAGGEEFAPTERFWTSLFARYGFNSSFFRFYSHTEVFQRISDKMSNDMMRLCIERGEKRNRLLAVSNPAKPLVDFSELHGLVGRYDSEKVSYANGIVESVHQSRASAGHTFKIGPDDFQTRFVMSTPIDGYGQPNVYLSLLRLLCTNGAIGYSKAFRSQIALGKGDDDVLPQLVRTLEGFGNEEGYAALRQRFESSQNSWASVYEANMLQRSLYQLYARQDLGGEALPKGTSIASWFAANKSDRMGSGTDAVGQTPIFMAFNNMTGNISHLYGLANIEALSVKRQRTLPVQCTMYDLLNFATEVATHYANPEAARRLQGWVGETISNEYDMENTKEAYGEFADFHMDSKFGEGLTGSEPSAN